MIQFLVTGTGRCGTGYAAELLTSAGIPCGHEDVYTPWGIFPQPGLDADSSWLAVPHLEAFQGRVVHLVRHPVEVVRSFISIGFFREHLTWPHRAFAFRHFKRTGHELDDALRWTIEWNARIEPRADIRIRLEDLPVTLSRLVGRSVEGWTDPPHRINERPRTSQARVPDSALGDQLRQLAERYGYDLQEREASHAA